MSETPRLHKYLAQCGVASRRKAEELILEGRVQVNGETITQLGTKVEPGDEVTVDGEPVALERTVVYLFFKPRDVVTTLSDPQGRRSVRDYLPPSGPAVKPVGRLDRMTDGLLLLTNDGELAMRLTHPSYGVEKEYRAVVQGIPDDRKIDRLARGVFVEGRKTAPAVVERTGHSAKEDTANLRLILHEGRKRQIRLMCDAVGHPVLSLRRVRLAHLTIKGMQPGEVRLLGQIDINRLRQSVGLS